MSLHSLSKLCSRPPKERSLWFSAVLKAVNRRKIPNPHQQGSKEEHACFCCHKVGRVIANCLALKRKTAAPAKPRGFVKTVQQTSPCLNDPESKPEDGFESFMFDGLVSLSGDPTEQKPARILRDTGASQSLSKSLPTVFPACLLTRAQLKKWGEESVLASNFIGDNFHQTESTTCKK